MEDKTCVVTGSSRGIGRGIAEKLGSKGANVVVNYRTSKEKAKEVKEEIESKGGNGIVVKADITSTDQVEDMKEKTHEEFGRIDVLVNNAGINEDVFFKNMTYEEWYNVLDVHLDGAFHCTQAFYDDLEKAENGRLINISSIVGEVGNVGQANYATAKSGIIGFTRTLALELARSETTVNCVSPGFINTDMLDGVPENVLENIKEDTPLGRLGTVEEIADVVAFIASEKSSFMTGEIVDVTGGKDL